MLSLLTDYNTLMAIVGGIATLGGAIAAVQKVLNNIKKTRKEEGARILQEAKEEVSTARILLEAEIQELKLKFDNLKESMEKDLDHARQAHNTEIKNLGEKIESLQQELRIQYEGLMTIFSKMIDSKFK